MQLAGLLTAKALKRTTNDCPNGVRMRSARHCYSGESMRIGFGCEAMVKPIPSPPTTRQPVERKTVELKSSFLIVMERYRNVLPEHLPLY